MAVRLLPDGGGGGCGSGDTKVYGTAKTHFIYKCDSRIPKNRLQITWVIDDYCSGGDGGGTLLAVTVATVVVIAVVRVRVVVAVF